MEKARDLYIDEILEIEDRENDQRLKAEDAAKVEAKRVKIEASNLTGVPDLFERMLAADPEYEKLRYIPNKEAPELCNGLELFKDKYQQRCEAFMELMDDQLERKKSETTMSAEGEVSFREGRRERGRVPRRRGAFFSSTIRSEMPE